MKSEQLSSDAPIDASALDLSIMGSMGMGGRIWRIVQLNYE